jgi:branched-chain amino acid transport system permease protein
MSGKQIFNWGCWIVAIFLLVRLPAIVPEMKVHLAIEILIFALFAVSFNLLLGYTGLLPFGYAAMFGMGGYACALVVNHVAGMPLLVTLLIAALAGLVSAAVVAFFAVRLAGTYFALITLAFQMFFFAVAMKWREVTNGDDGMGVDRPDLYIPGIGDIPIAGLEIGNLYYLTLAVAGLGILIMFLFLKTPLGNAVICMRENDERAPFLGYNVFLTKLTVFSFAGFFAGIAGALYVLFNEFVATTAIDSNMSFTIVLMTVIGGTGRFLGPVLGVAFFMLFQDWISDLTVHWWLYMGIVFVLVVLFLEGGLISLFSLDRFRVLMGRRED